MTIQDSTNQGPAGGTTQTKAHANDASYVLPAPPRGAGALIYGDEPAYEGARPQGTDGVARAFGERFLAQAESLDLFLAELRDRLASLDAAIAEDSRAQLKGAVREIGSVVDWCEAVQRELQVESARAVAGQEPIDLVAICELIASSRQEMTDPISVVSKRASFCWGERAAIAHLLHKALDLVWERTGRHGLRCLEVDWQDAVPCVRVRSRGEPRGDVDPDCVDRFRSAVERVGAAVVPDEQGPGGAGFVLRLPS